MTPSFVRTSLPWIFAIVLSASHPISAAVVTSCDEAGLRAALAAGGPVTFGCDGTIVLSNAVALATSASIDTAGHDVTLSGGGKVRIFEIGSGGVVRLKGLKLMNGYFQGATGAPAVEGWGGGVLMSGGQFHATDCVLMNNLVEGGPGGEPSGEGVDFSGASGRGGAIYVAQGTLRLTNCSFLLNIARGGRGGSAPFPWLGVSGGNGYGAAVSTLNSDVVVVDSHFGGNRAEGGDAGLIGIGGNWSGSGSGGGAEGGAWHGVNSTSAFIRTSFRTNAAVAHPPHQIVPSGASGTNAFGGSLAVEAGTTVVDDGVFETNQALGGEAIGPGRAGSGCGGGIHNTGTLELRRCLIRGNVTVSGRFTLYGKDSRGGGIHNLGSLVLRDSLVNGNTVLHGRQSFAIPGILDPGYTSGGGLWNGGTAHLFNSSFTFNTSQAPGPIYLSSFPPFPRICLPAFGGGIFNTGQLTAVNVTLSENAVRGGDAGHPDVGGTQIPGGDALGGGIYHTNGSCFLTNVTIARNESVGGKGSPSGARLGENLNIGSGGFSLIISIVANEGPGSNCVGILMDLGLNISSDSSCQFTATGSLNNTDPKLGPFGDYTGATPTIPLLAGSPAIDSAAASSCPPTDQRGRTRPFGAGCDIGAFESSAPYSVFGHISGWNVPEANIQISSGALSTSLGVSGNFVLNGLSTGTHTVIPSSPTGVFIQSNAVVTLGPDKLVNFHSYRSNAVTLELNSSPGTHRVVFAGETGRSYRLFGSSALPIWTPLQTNMMSSSQIFDYFESDAGSPGHRFYKVESP